MSILRDEPDFCLLCNNYFNDDDKVEPLYIFKLNPPLGGGEKTRRPVIYQHWAHISCKKEQDHERS